MIYELLLTLCFVFSRTSTQCIKSSQTKFLAQDSLALCMEVKPEFETRCHCTKCIMFSFSAQKNESFISNTCKYIFKISVILFSCGMHSSSMRLCTAKNTGNIIWF